MFSDTFCLADKYDLATGEKVSTVERMPRRFTSLESWQYLPALDQNIVDKLNLYFDLKIPHVSYPLLEEKKYFDIEYTDEGIRSFYSINPINWNVLTDPVNYWKAFVKTIQCPEMESCRTKIDQMTDVTDAHETMISGILYDQNANYTGLRLFDPTYNLQEYSNDLINKLNGYCLEQPDAKGTISFLQDRDMVGFRTLFDFAEDRVLKIGNSKSWKSSTMVNIMKPHILTKLVDNDIIDADEREFIETTCVGQSYFSLEHVATADGKLHSKHFIHHKVDRFKDLTVL